MVKKTAKDERKKELAAALRLNLRRRKASAKEKESVKDKILTDNDKITVDSKEDKNDYSG